MSYYKHKEYDTMLMADSPKGGLIIDHHPGFEKIERKEYVTDWKRVWVDKDNNLEIEEITEEEFKFHLSHVGQILQNEAL